ncbi:hypothetical protein [Asticcacaulis solisilvae]|uniref:hypothetical protein n=1 Tax=Asticcacaulis solisilvae TaxID=1217274 RepID=UPI003FD6E56F
MTVHIVWMYWWLIFPIGFLLSRIVHMFLYSAYERKRLDVLKAYIDKGKDVPPALYRDL